MLTPPILLALLLATVVAWFLIVHVPAARTRVVESWRRDLSTRADVRKEAIQQYFHDAIADAETFTSYPTLLRVLGAPSAGVERPGSAAEAAAHLEELFDGYVRIHGVVGAGLWDAEGKVVAKSRAISVEAACAAPARDDLSSGASAAGFHLHAGFGPILTASAPVRFPDGSLRGAMVVALDPESWLYPLIAQPLAGTTSGESYLVVRNGSDIVYLSPLRHRPDATLTFRRRLDEDQIKLREVLEQSEAVTSLVDYRGIRVLAARRRIPPSPWVLVVKIDEKEAMADVEAETRRTGLVLAALLTAIVGIAWGIWQKQRRDQAAALLNSETRLTTILDQAIDAIVVAGSDGRIRFLNRVCEEIYGIPLETLRGRALADFRVSEQREAALAKLDEILRTGRAVFESEHEKADGSRFPVEVSARAVEIEGEKLIVAVIRDITDRRRADDRIRQLNRLLRTITEINQLIVRTDDKETLLSETCRVVVEHGGYQMAWVGLADRETGLVLPAARAGEASSYLEQITIRFDETPEGLGPVGTAVRLGRPVVVPDLAAEPTVEPWRERMLAHGFRTTGAFPFRVGGEVAGALTVYAADAGTIGDEESALLDELAADIGYAIDSIQERVARREGEKAFREAEEKYRGIFENAVEGIFQTTPGGRFITVNPSFAQMLGYESPEAVLLAFHDIRNQLWVHPEQRDEYRRLLETDGFVRGFEHELWRKDGTILWASESSRAVRDSTGVVECIEGTLEDITERRKAEQALSRSRETMIGILDANPDAVVLLDVNFRIVACNRVVAEEFGRDIREMIGISPFDMMPPDLASHRRERLKQAIETGCTVRDREKLAGRYYDVILVPIKDGSGHVEQVAVYKRDVTEIVRADAELARSELYFKSLIEHAADITAVLGPGGDIRYVSPSVEGVLGYLPAEIRGLGAVDLVHPEDQPEMLLKLRRLQKGSTRLETFEGRLRHRDGSWRVLSVVGKTLLPETGMTGVILNGRDVTDRLKAEENLRKLQRAVEQSPASVVITDIEGRIEYVNRKFTEISGYGVEEALGQNPRILKSEQTPRSVHEDLWRTIKAGGMWQGEFCNKKKSGEVFWELASISPVRGPDGTISHFVAVKEDITEKKRSAEILAEAQRELIQAQKMEAVGRLAGGVAHDFNNLLTVIQGYGEILRSDIEAGDPRSESLEEILTAAGRATNLTRQLLAFSRKQVSEPRLVRLDVVVNDMAKMLGRLIGEDVEMTVLAEPDLPQIRTDPAQMEQVLMNLAVNSRDAMPSGGNLTVLLEVERLSAALEGFPERVPPGDWVVLSVADSGIGMSSETLSHVFEPFFTTKEVGKGTGLGLATVWGIVKQSGGYIQVYSHPGAGATFRVYLPKVEGTRQTSGIRPAVKREASESILLVEDEPAVRNLTRTLLEGDGYRVLVAASPSEAVALAERPETRIDLLLTDVVMPEMTGPELAERVRTLRPSVKVLFMSGYSSDALKDRSDIESFTTLLPKPFTPAALKEKLREVLDEPGPPSA